MRTAGRVGANVAVHPAVTGEWVEIFPKVVDGGGSRKGILWV
jgi:hypothetical protein